MGAQAGPGPGPAGTLPPGAEPRLPCPWARALATMAPAPPWASTSRHTGPSCSRAGRPAWLLESYARPHSPRQAALGVGHSQAPRTPAGNPGGEFPERWGRGFWKREESRREQDRAPQIGTLVLPRVRAAAGSGGWKDPPGPRPPRGSHGHRSCGRPHFVTDCFPVFH